MVTCPCGAQKQEAPCLRGGRNLPLGSTGNVRLSCNEECNSQRRLRAFATAVGKMSTTEEFSDFGSSASDGLSGTTGPKPVVYSGFLLRFAETETMALEYFEKEMSAVVLGKTKKVKFDALPKLHRVVIHELAGIYNLDSESTGREPNRQITVRHRGPGMKPVLPKPLLSEAYFTKKREESYLYRNPLCKSLIIHVPSLAGIHGSADITARVERELKMHAGFCVLVRKELMKNNLTGVLVRFSTRERMMMAKEALSLKPGISVQSFDAESNKATGSARPADNDSPDTSTSWLAGESSSSSSSVQDKAPAVSDENAPIPDSWEDD